MFKHREEDRAARRRREDEELQRRREERKKRHADKEKYETESKKRRRNESDKSKEKDTNETVRKDENTKQPVVSSNEKSANEEDDNATVTDPKARITDRERNTVKLLTSRTGGAYIPPAKLRMMQDKITDKSSAAYQRIAWEALKKSIHGYINKVNVDNIAIITRELLRENIVRGRGLICRSIIQAQAASPTFTHVYAALVAIINSKFPNIGELLLKRLIIQFKSAYCRNDKRICMSSCRFIAHLINQGVAHEIIALEILSLLIESPTDDSVEVAIAFLKECGMKLTEVSSKGVSAIFEMLKNILHEGKLDKRVQYMIEVIFQVRKDGFKDHPSIVEELELVEEEDQFTHLLSLDPPEKYATEELLNAFKFDDEYETNENKYKELSHEILGSETDSANSDSSDGDSDGDNSDEDDDDGEDGKQNKVEIIDNTETNLIALRRTIYLTINSSLDYEECAHKLIKLQLKPGQEGELCHMFLDCCAEQRTYEKFFGLLSQRFCSINKAYVIPFEEIFKDTFETTHRLDTNRLRNVSKFFAHLLYTDAISWDILECIKLNEDDTTSSNRIFIKILFQELAEYMGLSKLYAKLKQEELKDSVAGIFPKDNPRNTRFSINFFTSIGLGGLTDELRDFLKSGPRSVPGINAEILQIKSEKLESLNEASCSASSSKSSSSSSSDSSSSDSPDSSHNKSKKSKKHSKKKSKKTKKKKKHSKKQKSKRYSSSSSSSSSDDSEDSDSESLSSDSTDRNKKKKSYKQSKNEPVKSSAKYKHRSRKSKRKTC
ncbi:pre-mRNA-splicing factor CWC22 homolog isoform X2 [Teleopsis dalmanni]|uniref:pre-mRNA-splicing factor CWC22 homolog isoform X2 n=1 Tax=Teleopsis dalmanni TaxID=139649 RepID=UPI0018CDB716|nr:pre-mRNA-splicing factor CWC22 homolog isoform X2 [Teleopsis dalmanni]